MWVSTRLLQTGKPVNATTKCLKPILLAILTVYMASSVGLAQSPDARAGRNRTRYDSKSFYVPMEDGVRLAVDVYFPEDFDKAVKYPAVMELTRYWRGMVVPGTKKVREVLSPIDKAMLANGYVIVRVDVRGSGASFGLRMEEYGPDEVRDGYALVDWVSKQPWSDGNVGAKGISYTGTTAELLASSNHPALKAVIPGWSDFDLYASPGRPYGMFPSGFLKIWGKMVGMMDNHDGRILGGNIRPVEGFESDLSGALKAHANNPDVYEMVRQAEFVDSVVGDSAPMNECTSLHWKDEIEKSNVPMLVFASWLDAGTADGALIRLQNYSNPQKVVILASNHGGQFHASPFVVSRKTVPSVPSVAEQIQMRLDFLDHYLKGAKNEVPSWPAIRYFNLNEEKMQEAATWPIPGTKKTTFYLRGKGALSKLKPDEDTAKDDYRVDFGASTGFKNRWMTQMGEPVLNLDNRARSEKRLLTYTSEPFKSDTQMTGSIIAKLHLASTHKDGSVLVYVSLIDSAEQTPEGKQPKSRYLTEGGIRLIHRKEKKDPDFRGTAPFHSFRENDAMEMVPGKTEEVNIRLLPTSVLIKKGQRLRISIAGHDDSIFERIPTEGEPVLTIQRNSSLPSLVELPTIGPH